MFLPVELKIYMKFYMYVITIAFTWTVIQTAHTGSIEILLQAILPDLEVNFDPLLLSSASVGLIYLLKYM